MKSKTIKQWSKELANKDSKYGGGSAASVVGAFAANLAQFVFELQQGKAKYEDNDDEIAAAIKKADELADTLLELAEEDADAFDPVLDLFKLPKDTEEEKEYRQKQIDQGLEKAAQPPFEIIENMDEVLDLFEELLALKVRGTITDDIAVGLYFTEATIEAGKINCMVNIKLIKDQDMKDRLTAEVNELYTITLNRARALKTEIIDIID